MGSIWNRALRNQALIGIAKTFIWKISGNSKERPWLILIYVSRRLSRDASSSMRKRSSIRLIFFTIPPFTMKSRNSPRYTNI